jgi:hypothetical protein
MGKITEA